MADMGVPHFNALAGSEYRDKLRLFKTRMIVLPDAEDRKVVCMYVPLDKTSEHVGLTDRRMDRRTDRIGLIITAVCIESSADVL